MKTNIKNQQIGVLVALCLLFFGFNKQAFSQAAKVPVENVEIKKLGYLRFQVNYENPTQAEVVVNLLDNGNIIFSGGVESNPKYSRVFNLKNLSDGKYEFVIMPAKSKNIKEKLVYPLEIVTESNRVILVKNK